MKLKQNKELGFRSKQIFFEYRNCQFEEPEINVLVMV